MALIRWRQTLITVAVYPFFMPISSHFSALSSWVLLIAKAIDSYGLDSEKLFIEGPVGRLEAELPKLVAEAGLVGLTPFDVAPDGERFIGIRQDPDQVPNRIRVVFHWLDELERLVPAD